MSQGEISSDSVSVESLLRQRLADLVPSRLELIDESAQHAGHAGAKNGGGHYRLLLVSAAFVGKSSVARHRMIYSALGELMHGKIHALSIESLAPNEV